jgi:hypothetical protein
MIKNQVKIWWLLRFFRQRSPLPQTAFAQHFGKVNLLLPGMPLSTAIRCPHPNNYPWRCLCFGSLQITRKTPLRRIILQLRHNFFTDARTFIIHLYLIT